MQIIISFITGLVFGLGLIVSGMANPSKVIGFLDLAGNWDPSLAIDHGMNPNGLRRWVPDNQTVGRFVTSNASDV